MPKTSPLRAFIALSTLPLLLGAAVAASGVIIETGDGSGNTTAPSPDPGWDYVGMRGGLTAVYLGEGWVLTANHVGAGDVTLGGVTYPYLGGTAQRLENPDETLADLLVFAISPYPDMPLLPIASQAPPLGRDLILVGHGRNRGGATSWDPNGPPPPGPIDGFDWAAGKTLRWGTNQVEDYPPDKVLGTWSFATYFDEGGSADEAQGATGDSGGAAFAFDGSDWELVGVIYAIGEYVGQPSDVSLYGQVTYAADLMSYRSQILDIVSLPEPSGALPAGALLLGALARRRRGRRSPASRRL